ncbi:hypothetical protein FHS29_007038 [Saccharothrix tamanrassetensis]|uniref:Protein kinase domain-containing protein n=1 Tax=Saccharothrix tamanrassetensis TaxID=1051531 RepID=A0A841CVS8_9PSEU|nr:hypothetical protein [Saccharothrix tamanrassetensis]MBB5960414.1 hypothetical protein [Saccharothrix tamanrassetensis]
MTTSPSFTWTSDEEPARSFPSGATYVEALQNTALCFRGTDLAGAEVRVDALGRPRAISGNFAGVFSLTVADGTRYAVKCFTREVREQATRYRAVGEHLARLDDDWTVGFDYIGRGILVEGTWYPVLRMEWVEAVNLVRWIERNTDDPAALSHTATRFARLVAELAAAGVGHGDLQHGNLLVCSDGSIKLVDYDGMYVPALAGLPAAETGHRNYQSPDRTAADFGPDVDRFSSWVVYLSLVALATDPSLWRQLRDEDAEHLLLAESDFADPTGSFRLATLTGHPDARLRGLAERFQDILLHHRAAPPPLEPLEPFDVVQPVKAPVPVIAALPAWMAERVQAQAHMPAPPPLVRFNRRTPALTVLTWVLLVLLLPFGVPAAVFVDEAMAIVDVSAVLAWTASTALGYRRQPEHSRARAARAERKRLVRARLAAAAHLTRLNLEARRIAQEAERSKAEQQRSRRTLQQRHNQRLGTHQRAVDEQLQRIDRDRQASAARMHLEEQRILVVRQKAHLRARLALFPVKTAGIEGMGPVLTANLEAVGIRTAADFVGVRYAMHGANRVAFFVLVDGSSVRAAGIGEVKAARIDQWREHLTTKAAGSGPTSLTPAERQILKDRFAAEKAGLDAQYEQVRNEAERTTRELREVLRAEQAALADELKAANTAIARTRVDHDRAVAEAAVVLERARQAAAEGVAQADAFRPVTYLGYLRFTATGRS